MCLTNVLICFEILILSHVVDETGRKYNKYGYCERLVRPLYSLMEEVSQRLKTYVTVNHG